MPLEQIPIPPFGACSNVYQPCTGEMNITLSNDFYKVPVISSGVF